MKNSILGSVALLLLKGRKNFLLMMVIMILGLFVAWKGVTLSYKLLCCADMNALHFYNGLVPRSVIVEQKRCNEKMTIQSREEVENGGSGSISARVEETSEHVTVPFQSAATDKGKIKEDAISLSSKKIVAQGGGSRLGCDYFSGKWVMDKSRPLYSGKKCHAWLSRMWACRLTDRLDFEFENYRWQSDRCVIPKFDGHTFLSRMKNKILAFVGDSIGRQQYQSMMCLITGGEDDLLIEDTSLKYDFVKPHGALRADGTAQRFVSTNTTIIFQWSSSLCEIEPLNRENHGTEFALHLDRPATFLQRYIDKLDVLVLNTGHHWNRGKFNANKWVMYVNGYPNKDRSLSNFKAAHNFAVHKVVAWLHQQLEKNHTKASIYMRSLSPRHFFNGEWDSGGTCDGGNIPVEKKNITGRIMRDLVAESAVSGTRVKLLNVTYLSQFRDEAHISKYGSRQGNGQDCLHWCLPGVPDIWNEILYADLLFQNISWKLTNREPSSAIL